MTFNTTRYHIDVVDGFGRTILEPCEFVECVHRQHGFIVPAKMIDNDEGRGFHMLIDYVTTRKGAYGSMVPSTNVERSDG